MCLHRLLLLLPPLPPLPPLHRDASWNSSSMNAEKDLALPRTIIARLSQEARNRLVVSAPSGNFGDPDRGSAGLPVQPLIAATNANNTVPRFLASGSQKRRCQVRMGTKQRTGRASSCPGVRSGACLC